MAKIDYSASADNLTNPESVRLLLLKRLGLNSAIQRKQDELAMRNVDLLLDIKTLSMNLDINKSEIENAVQTDGGYQDVDAGLYGLRQRRVSYTYDPYWFKKVYPEFAPAVIKEIVDTDKIKGFIKGGLLKMEDLLHKSPLGNSVATENLSLAFIIRADPQTEVKGK